METTTILSFIREHSLQHEWIGDELICWIDRAIIKDFCEMVGPGVFSDGPLTSLLCSDGSLAIDLVPICDYFGIDTAYILNKE